MSFESFLEKITTPPSPDSILACEAGVTGLKVSVIEKKGEKLTVNHEVTSHQVDFNDAVEEAVQKVKSLGWKGQHAILVNPAVCLTVVDLSIPPKNKLAVQQIADTVHWELEPIYNQYKTIFSIGQILQLLGYISADHVEQLIQQQNELINSKNSAVTYKRFGELALAEGFVSQQQLDDALSKQKWFLSDSDALKCGWQATTRQRLAAETGDYQWIISGIKQDLVREWQAAFKKQGVQLEALYPAINSEQNAVDNDALGQDHELILEVQPGMVSGTVLFEGEPAKIQSLASNSATILSRVGELNSGFGLEDVAQIRLYDAVSSDEQQSQQLLEDIQTIIGQEVVLGTSTPSKISSPLRNAVRHFLKAKHSHFVMGVSVHEPLPPVMQRFSVRAVLAGLFILGIIAIAELGLIGSRLWIESGIASISDDVGRIRGEIKRVNTKISKVKSLKAQVKKKELAKKNLTTTITLLSKELPERNQTLLQLMTRLQETLNEDVVINSIIEDTLLGFDFSVWTLNEEAAQAFVKNFQLSIHPMNYRVKNMTVSEQTGRLGLIGYSLNFSITQLSETEWNKRKSQPNRRRY